MCKYYYYHNSSFKPRLNMFIRCTKERSYLSHYDKRITEIKYRLLEVKNDQYFSGYHQHFVELIQEQFKLY